jgi:hypothetical protein
MTLRYMDGFDYLPSGSTNTDRLLEAGGYYLRGAGTAFNPNATNTAALGRFDYGECLSYNTTIGSQTSTLNMVRPIDPGSTFTEGYQGWAVKIGKTSAVPTLFYFYDAISDAPQVVVELGVNGVIRIYRGGSYGGRGTLLLTSHAGAYYFDEWFYLEIFGKIHTTAGEVEVRVNTQTVLSLVTANTQATALPYFDSTGWGALIISFSSVFVAAIDDHYFCDSAGTENNGFLGNVRVKCQLPVSNGDNIDFTAVGAASNWQGARNTLLTDTIYDYSPNIGDYDLYHMDPILNAPLVHGIQTRMGLRQDDATQRIAHPVIKTGGVEFEGVIDHYLNQTYTYYFDIWELNPDTGVGWTGTEVNALQAGPKVAA